MSGSPAAAASAAASAAIEAALNSLGLGFEQPRPGAFLVRLEGQHKLATMTWLVAGEHSLGEWAWRVKRGESLANLQAFARFADPEA